MATFFMGSVLCTFCLLVFYRTFSNNSNTISMTFFHFFYFMVTGREIHLLFLSKICICFNDSVTCKNNKAGMGSSKSCTDFIDCYDLIFLYANGRILNFICEVFIIHTISPVDQPHKIHNYNIVQSIPCHG